MQRITLTKPDDWHLHLRGGHAMKSVVGMSALQMGRAVIMPNLSPPIRDVSQAIAYRKEIMSALPAETTFNPLMVLYLTDSTTKNEIIEASEAQEVHAVKFYPAGATTNSDSGVTNLLSAYPAIEQMQKEGLPLLIHGEVTDIDIGTYKWLFSTNIDSDGYIRGTGEIWENYPELTSQYEFFTLTDRDIEASSVYLKTRSSGGALSATSMLSELNDKNKTQHTNIKSRLIILDNESF